MTQQSVRDDPAPSPRQEQRRRRSMGRGLWIMALLAGTLLSCQSIVPAEDAVEAEPTPARQTPLSSAARASVASTPGSAWQHTGVRTNSSMEQAVDGIQLAYFYRPSDDATDHRADIAARSGIVILQKEDQQYREALRRAGYRGPILQYFLLLEVQNPRGVAHAPWGNNWAWKEDDYSALPDTMFLQDANGKRITGGESGYTYLDPGSPDAREFIRTRLREAYADGFDGIFLDNVRVTMRDLAKRAGGAIHDARGMRYSEATFLQRELELVALIKAELGDHPLWGNMIDDPRTGTAWDPFMAYLDGGMFEDFATGYTQVGHGLSTAEWLGNLQQAERVLARGKGIIAVGQGKQGNTDLQRFALGSFLLIGDGTARSSFRYTMADAGYGEWWDYPSYDLDCGQPLGTRYASGKSWKRSFEHCRVTVDPRRQTVTIEELEP